MKPKKLSKIVNKLAEERLRPLKDKMNCLYDRIEKLEDQNSSLRLRLDMVKEIVK